MEKLRARYKGTSGSSLLFNRFQFWTSWQVRHESIQKWKVKVRQVAVTVLMVRSWTSFAETKEGIFGQAELLKTHFKPDNLVKILRYVVEEARAIESAMQTNKKCTGPT